MWWQVNQIKEQIHVKVNHKKGEGEILIWIRELISFVKQMHRFSLTASGKIQV